MKSTHGKLRFPILQESKGEIQSFAMDLLDIDLDVPTKEPLKTSKFQPKQSKFKPKAKQEQQSLPVPRPESSFTAIPKTEPGLVSASVSDSTTLPKKEYSELDVSPCVGASREDAGEAKGVEPMNVDGVEEEREDRIVREIDVFFTPTPVDDNTRLYVLQYPLRPCWRPYENFQEVRLKQKQSQLEIDLEMNFESQNYDPEVLQRLKLEKQTLSSSEAPLVTGYAVGILKQNKLHLSPVHSVLQLRPSMEYLKKDTQKKSAAEGNVESSASSDGPCVSLEYHDAESMASINYRQKMTAEESSHIQFSMNPYDYVSSLCPKTSSDINRAKDHSIRALLSLPLEERFKKWFSEGSEARRFSALMHLAPESSEEEVLEVLKQYSYLVQGMWVVKSKLRCGGVGLLALARDYVLLLFSKNQFIQYKQLKSVAIPNDILEKVLIPLAVRTYRFTAWRDWNSKEPDDWKFKDTDELFKRSHPHIVEEQQRDWLNREKHIMDSILGCRKGGSAKTSLKSSVMNSATADRSAKGGTEVNSLSSAIPSTMSKETREALPKALEELFSIHKVCSLQLICQGLRDMAISKSSLTKSNPRAAIAASLAASAPLPELQAVVKQLAVDIHGVYVWKPQGYTDDDKLRRAVIDLFCGKEPNAKLKKADVVEAAKIILKREITDQEYIKVVKEYCISIRGSWVLKSSDATLR